MSLLYTSSPSLSSFLLNAFLNGPNSYIYHRRLNICKYRAILPQSCFCSPSSCLFHRKVITVEGAVNSNVTEGFKLKWREVGPDLTEAEKHEISQLSSTLTNRCKALLRRIICFSQEEDLFVLLASWVKAMQPERCDWLSVLKEIQRIDNSLFFEAMEYALHEESFEANARDYTKLIDALLPGYLRAAGLKPNDKCVAVMLRAYRKEKKMEEALDLLMGLEGDGVVMESEASEVLAQWLRGLGVIHELELALR